MNGSGHEALLYADEHELVEQVAPFLEAGVAEGAPAIAVLRRRNWAALREALGTTADDVTYHDCDDFYVHPARTLAAYDSTVRRLLAEGATSVRVTGEIPLGPTEVEWSKWTAYEATLNRAFAGRPTEILCAYNLHTTPDPMLTAVWETHREVTTGEERHLSLHYHDPEELVAALAPAPASLPTLHRLAPGNDPLAFREQLAASLAAARIPEARAMDMLVAANEVFLNACRHGGEPTDVRVGLVDGWFVCEISDAGPGEIDPLAGYLPPSPERPGEGLWVARQLVSRVELIAEPGGLTARLWL
jgi:anti-sigma regulatory factor (Ser/Thr protein kinase)